MDQLITVILKHNKGLRWLNLSSNEVSHKPADKYKEINESLILNVCNLVQNSYLQHLNMS